MNERQVSLCHLKPSLSSVLHCIPACTGWDQWIIQAKSVKRFDQLTIAWPHFLDWVIFFAGYFLLSFCYFFAIVDTDWSSEHHGIMTHRLYVQPDFFITTFFLPLFLHGKRPHTVYRYANLILCYHLHKLFRRNTFCILIKLLKKETETNIWLPKILCPKILVPKKNIFCCFHETQQEKSFSTMLVFFPRNHSIYYKECLLCSVTPMIMNKHSAIKKFFKEKNMLLNESV